jgi:hypothetical protein
VNFWISDYVLIALMKKVYGTTKKEWDNWRRKKNRIDGKTERW